MINKKSILNLKPWKPGECGNKLGKPAGAIDLRKRLRIMFEEKGADAFTDVIWELCVVDKNVEMIKTVLRVAGALDNPITNQVNIQQNTIINEDVIAAARAFLNERNALSSSL
jgi:hypothetical protein